MTKEKPSPNKKAQINRENYASYVANLEATGAKFPINQFGSANLSLIAENCGFKRGVIQNEESFLGKAFRKDLERIGTALPTTRNTGIASEVKANEASKYAARLEIVSAEVEQLRKALSSAQEEIQLLKKQKEEETKRLELMLETGRRVFL